MLRYFSHTPTFIIEPFRMNLHRMMHVQRTALRTAKKGTPHWDSLPCRQESAETPQAEPSRQSVKTPTASAKKSSLRLRRFSQALCQMLG